MVRLKNTPTYSKLAMYAGLSYFLLAPIPQFRVQIGFLPVIPLLGIAAFLCWLFDGRRHIPRVYTSKHWTASLLALGFSILLGYLLADAYVRPSINQKLMAFAVPVLLISVLPRDTNVLMRHWKVWTLGICLLALLQIKAGILDPTGAGAEHQFSTSRFIHNTGDIALTQQFGIANAYGYMVMAICAGGCLSMLATANRSRFQKLLICALFVLSAAVVTGTYMAAAIVLVISLAVSTAIIFNKRNLRRNIFWPASFLLAIAFMISLLSQFDYTDIVLQRITRLRLDGLSGDQSTEIRWELVMVSLNTFASSPFWGVGLQGWEFDYETIIGGHSSIVDVPAQLGIIGFVAYYGLFVPVMLRSWSIWKAKGSGRLPHHAVVAGGLASLLACSILNPAFMMQLVNETMLLLVALGLSHSDVLMKRGNFSRARHA